MQQMHFVQGTPRKLQFHVQKPFPHEAANSLAAEGFSRDRRAI
jgi:hypothetical protein